MSRSLVRLPLPSFLVWNRGTDEVAIQQPGLIIESVGEISLMDKNSLWGELNIQKGELCVKEVFGKFLGSVLEVFGRFLEGSFYKSFCRIAEFCLSGG